MNSWTLTIPPHHESTTLDAFIGLFRLGGKKKQRLRTEGRVTVDGETVPWDRPLKAGASVTFDLSPFETPDFSPEPGKLTILHEDEWMLVFDKPCGLIVYPDTLSGTGTLVNRIAALYQRRGWDRPVRFLHRLDRDTTGCFAVAKNVLTHSYFSSLWDHQQIERRYLALVTGCPSPASGVISKRIGRDRHVQNRYRVSSTGEEATTEYEVLKDYKGYALVRLRLLTGKTHQIRVHMAAIGHPLLGDGLYGGPTDRINRVALHSESLSYPDPLTQTIQTVRAPLPADMAALTH
jgi:23S rRNA pseudouridine1911/1915/1917 synthase